MKGLLFLRYERMKNMAKSYEMDMCNGPILGKVLTYSIPLMLSGVLQLLFNAADVIVVGRFAGSQSLAAVGSTSSLINLLINVFIGLSIGANVLVARYYGAKNDRDMSETIHTAITVSLMSGLFLVFLGLFTSRFWLELMGTPDDVIDKSTIYMRIYFAGMPATMVYNFGSAILRAIGDTKRPLYFLTVAGVINAALNIFFVTQLQMDVAGVALATVISQCISCVMVLSCLIRTESSYQLSLKKLRIRPAYLLQIFQVGIPAGIQSTVITFSNVLLQSSVNSFGSTAMAGYTAANNIFGFLYTAINSVSQACMSFTSQNYGAGKKKRMDLVLRDCLILTVVIGLLMGGGAYLFGPELLHIYTSDEAVIACGMEILLYTTVTYFLCGIMDLIPGALRGMGRSAVPMLLSVIGTVGTRIVWIYLIFPAHRSLSVLFISYPVSWLATIIMQAACFFFVRRNVHSKMK